MGTFLIGRASPLTGFGCSGAHPFAGRGYQLPSTLALLFLKCFTKGSNVISILGCILILDSPNFP